MISLLTISIVAIAAVALVAIGGLYAYRSFRARRDRNRGKDGDNKNNHGTRKKSKVVREESARQLTTIHEASSNNETANESNNEQLVSNLTTSPTRNNQVNESEEVKSSEESKLNKIKELITESITDCDQTGVSPVSQGSKFDRNGRRIPVIDGRSIRAYPSVGDENVDPVGDGIKPSNGTMSSGSFGNESLSPRSAGSGTCLVRRSRIPRKIRDIEPDPRDAERYEKTQSNTPAPFDNPSPEVSPAVSLPSPVSIKTQDSVTMSPLTSSSSGVGRTAFNAKQIKD